MRVFLSLALGAAMASAASEASAKGIGEDHVARRPDARVVFVDPEVKVTFMTTGGAEFRQDWTDQAEQNLTAAIEAQLTASQDVLLRAAAPASPPAAAVLAPPVETPALTGIAAAADAAAAPAASVVADAAALEEQRTQALLLRDAIVSAVVQHHAFVDVAQYRGPLPHWKERAEVMSFGDAINAFTEGQEADYALFFSSNNVIESGGLFWTNVMIQAVTGVAMPSSNFRGAYAILADADTGDVVWLNARTMGDPRNPAEAATIVAQVFKNGPLSK